MTVFNFSLKGKVAIVTGASRGIGKAIALAFGDAGADVVCASRTLEALESTAQEIRAKGRRALAVPTDTSKKEDIDNMVARTIKEFGTVDILVNDAARNLMVPIMKMREDGWDKVMGSGLKGYFLAAQAAGKIMMEHRKGSIINISSINATFVDPFDGAYSVAKAGVVQMTRAIAGGAGIYGIRCNTICPGMTRTTMTENIWNDPKLTKSFADVIPVRRLGEPDEIAAVALFLASDASSYVTGATIYVDGGLSLSGFSPSLMGATLPEHLQL